MKLIAPLVAFLLLLTQATSAQPSTCQTIAELVVHGLQNRSMEAVLPHLSDDFTVLHYDGYTAKTVLEQLAQQLGATSDAAPLLEENHNEDRTVLSYRLTLEGMGPRTLWLTFDPQQQLQRVELEGMSVEERDVSEEAPYGADEQRVQVVRRKATEEFPDLD